VEKSGSNTSSNCRPSRQAHAINRNDRRKSRTMFRAKGQKNPIQGNGRQELLTKVIL
jgi:hypothetical protein